ncbi:AAA family ATPase [Chrysiogenes arsenatis]|uniref:AAA family ATPase n=1 Tax=Chrysiogenes arsenatis TaxID=309797 RepID=UPI0003FD89F8|nr:AAA family ATPase [Chrysiogenes arsenatis]
MKFKRLEIRGFKSFADKGVLEFRDGITSIVGPNGCGKSNISDAIRWVMGEQKAKDLRGTSMSDVIFGGTQRRPPAEMAEVKLRLVSETFPHPYNEFQELEVIRRLTTRGGSEYMINGTAARLRDVRSIFLDSGVGTRAMSIIEQGQIHQIVTSRPQERRAVIEEAAGINKFKESKKEALTKLEGVRTNLLRVQDVTEEVRKQYNYLKNQASKALRYKELVAEIYELETQILSKQYHDNSARLQAYLEQAKQTAEQRTTQQQQMDDLQKRLSTEYAHMTRLEAKQTWHLKQQEELTREHLLLTQKQESITHSLTQFDTYAGQESVELTELDRMREALEGEVERFRAKATENQSRQQTLREEMEKQEKALLMKRKKLEGLREELELARKDSFTAKTEITNNRNRVIDLESALKQTVSDIEKCQKEENEVRQEVATATDEHHQATLALTEIETEIAALREQIQAAEAAKNAAAEQLDSLRRQQGEAKGTLYERLSQSETLKKMIAKAQTAPPDEHQGDVLSTLKIRPGYETPFFTLLGAAAYGYIVADSFQGEGAQIATGATTQPVTIDGAQHISTLVDEQPPFAFPPNLYYADAAASLARQHPTAIFANQQGVLYHANCCFGAGTGAATDIYALQTQLITLASEIADAEQVVQRLDAELINGEAATRTSAMAVAELQHRTQSLAPEGDARRRTVAEYASRLGMLQRHLATIAHDRERIESRAAQANEQIDALKKKIKEFGSREQDLEFELEDIAHSIEYIQPEIEQEMENVNNSRIRLARIEEIIQAETYTLKDKEAKLDDTTTRIAALTTRMADFRQREADAKTEMEQIATRLDVIARTLDENNTILQEVNGELDQMGEEAKSFKARLAAFRDSLAKLEEKANAVHLEIERHKILLDNLTRQAEEKSIELVNLERYALGPELFDEKEATMELGNLRGKLQSLGSVNLDSIDAYQEIENRYTFMIAQQEDLEKSVATIEEGINKIDQSTKKRFMETFHAVNEQFQIVFPRLFRGGTAYLKLTDDDVLEAGLEIIAEPPGTRPKTLNLLSGGQKTLTAAALIFAIFLVKPSPFCFMDEVDAPLDDSNVIRFSEMVKELAHGTQFVIITHNQRTMEAADRLYGVTMEEPGVSKIVSVDLSIIDEHFMKSVAG